LCIAQSFTHRIKLFVRNIYEYQAKTCNIREDINMYIYGSATRKSTEK
jgi:hypothetical protein